MKDSFSRSDSAIVGYAHFKNLGSMMPMRYDETVSKRYGVNLLVGSPILSVIVGINQQPGILEFYGSAWTRLIFVD